MPSTINASKFGTIKSQYFRRAYSFGNLGFKDLYRKPFTGHHTSGNISDCSSGRTTCRRLLTNGRKTLNNCEQMCGQRNQFDFLGHFAFNIFYYRDWVWNINLNSKRYFVSSDVDQFTCNKYQRPNIRDI